METIQGVRGAPTVKEWADSFPEVPPEGEECGEWEKNVEPTFSDPPEAEVTPPPMEEDEESVAEAKVKKANEIHLDILARKRTNLAEAIAAGELLESAYAIIGRKEWKAWLKPRFAGSYETATIYRRLARHKEFIKDCKSIDEAIAKIRHMGKALASSKDEEKLEREKRADGAYSFWQEGSTSGSKADGLSRHELCLENIQGQFKTWLKNGGRKKPNPVPRNGRTY
jgi:hypothetical protein